MTEMSVDMSWEPSDRYVRQSRLGRFLERFSIANYHELIERCSADVGWFWQRAIEDLDLPWQRRFARLRDESSGKEWATWFAGGAFNITQSCLDRWDGSKATAIVAENELGEVRTLDFTALISRVADVVSRLRAMGVTRGDRIGIYMSMTPEAVATLLACARIGAPVVPLFSGYGWDAIRSRLLDADVRYVVTQDVMYRRGRRCEMKLTLDEALSDGVVVSGVGVWQFGGRTVALHSGRDWLWGREPERVPSASAEVTDVDHMLLLAYTSGSTGRPKACVHVHGGLPIKACVDFAYCFDIGRGSRVLWISDMGWLLAPTLVYGVLSLGGTLVLYDGAIDFPDPSRLWQLAYRHEVTHLGIAPTAVRALMRAPGLDWEKFNLPTLQYLAGTGEPWDAVTWRWFSEAFGRDRCPVINYSGGTEIGGGIVAGNPLISQRPCSFAGPIPGMDADVVDEKGNPIRGSVGELVVRQTWPGMTRGFLHDPDRYLSTYWSRFDGLWVQGDWASVASDGLWYISGRSDDVINIAGRRVGPSEVEAAAMSHPDIIEVAAVGLPHDVKGSSLACFVVPRVGASQENLAEDVRNLLEARLGRPMRPDLVAIVAELPKTRNGKILRRVVQRVYMGVSPGDVSALENPSAIEAIRASHPETPSSPLDR